MSVAKVIVDDTTIMDITDTTAIASDVASGEYFYTADGVKTAGTATGYAFELNNLFTNSTKWEMALGTSDYNFIDMANGDYFEMKWFEPATTNGYPDLLGYGTNINNWSSTSAVLFYLGYNSNRTQYSVVIRQNAVNTYSSNLDASLPHTIKVDKDYVYVDDVAVVATLSAVVTNQKPHIGSSEGSKRFEGTYNYIRIVKGA